MVALDPVLDEALRGEGWAREFVHRVQRLRREGGLALTDRIRLEVCAPEAMRAALEEHRAYVCGETLCCDLEFVADTGGETYRINGEEVGVRLERVATD